MSRGRTSQLGLFCDVSRVRHYFDDDAPAIYREPSACGGCHTVRKIITERLAGVTAIATQAPRGDA